MVVAALCTLLLHNEGCRWCGAELTGRRFKWCSRKCDREHTANHRWTQAKAAAKARRVAYQCERCQGFFGKVEVNHIVPCKGKHGTWGCHHHQTNLEVLCPPCHKTTTDEQRKRGWT